MTIACPNILVLRSMTKDCGLAGLRLGYAVGQESVIASLRQVQPPWSVNALAQAAGIAALGDVSHRQRCLENLPLAKHDLIAGLEAKRLTVVPSHAHFFMVKVGDGAAFRAALLRRSLLVRACASFGLPAFVRIATREPDQNLRLLAAIEEVA
jgi:histidinol-phosphate/aromatic aminotransferase/cobyric acid decarboxylase-like protein